MSALSDEDMANEMKATVDRLNDLLSEARDMALRVEIEVRHSSEVGRLVPETWMTIEIYKRIETQK